MTAFAPALRAEEYADTSAASTGPGLRLFAGTPYGGLLDRYHNVTRMGATPEEKHAIAIYAVRNVVVQDSLEKRRILRSLIGNEDALASLGKQYLKVNFPLSYAVPRSVRVSYTYPKEWAGDEIPELAESIRSLDGPADSSLSLDQRERMTAYLAFLSARVAEFDQLIQHFTWDYWKDSGIDDQFQRKFVVPEVDYNKPLEIKFGYCSIKTYQDERENWMARHMSERLSKLYFLRQTILTVDHFLAVQVGRGVLAKAPLYQHLYRALEDSGFAKRGMVQKPASPILPGGRDPIPFPTGFTPSLRMWQIIQSETKLPAGHRPFLSNLYARTKGFTDEALVVDLNTNTNLLARYTSERDYVPGGNIEELALADSAWEAAEKKYGYLADFIDFKAERAYFQARLATKAHRKKIITNIFAGTAGVLGAAALVTGIGGALELPFVDAIGMSTKGFLYLSGFTAAISTGLHDYWISKPMAEFRENLFFASRQQLTYDQLAEAQDKVALSSRDFTVTMAALVFTVIAPWSLDALAGARAVVADAAAGTTDVVATTGELKAARSALAGFITSEEAAAVLPGGEATLAEMRTVLNAEPGIASLDQPMAFDDAVKSVARDLKKPESWVWDILKKNPLTRTFATFKDEWVDGISFLKLKTSKRFLCIAIADVLIGIGADVVADVNSRGRPRTPQDYINISLHVGTGVFVNLAIDFAVFKGIVEAEKAAATAGMQEDFSFFKLSGREKVAYVDQAIRSSSRTLMGAGMRYGFLVTSSQEALDFWMNPHDKTIGERATNVAFSTAYWGLTLATVSATKGTLVGGVAMNETLRAVRGTRVDRLIYGQLAKSLKAETARALTDILYSAAPSFASNFVGGAVWVKGALTLGVQSKTAVLDTRSESVNDVWVKLDQPVATEPYVLRY